jgi:hypothetical protein
VKPPPRVPAETVWNQIRLVEVSVQEVVLKT